MPRILTYTDEQVRAMLEEPDHWLAHLRRAARHRGFWLGREGDVVSYLRGWLAARDPLRGEVPEHVEDGPSPALADTVRTISVHPERIARPGLLGVRTPVARVVGNARRRAGGQ